MVRGASENVRGARGGECARSALRAAIGAGADGARLRRQRREPTAERNARVAPARVSVFSSQSRHLKFHIPFLTSEPREYIRTRTRC